METMSVAIVLVGLGALEAGLVGALLPAHDRLGAVLALVAGAGVGVIGLALGAAGGATPEGWVFLVASAAGFLTVSAVLGIVWRRAARDQSGSGDDRAATRSSTRQSVR
jgi:hypothetical protein